MFIDSYIDAIITCVADKMALAPVHWQVSTVGGGTPSAIKHCAIRKRSYFFSVFDVLNVD